MNATLSRANLKCEVFFRKPLFELLGATAHAAEVMYETIGEQFPLSLADINVTSGSSPANVSVRTSLFSGLGSIELWVDRYQATFRTLRTAADLRTVTGCLNVTNAAIRRFSERCAERHGAVEVASWYACEGGSGAVTALLSEHGPKQLEVDPAFLDAEQIDFSISLRLRNPSEGWTASFTLDQSLIDGADLFVLYNGSYLSGGRYNSPEERAAHIERLYQGILGRLGITLVGV